MENDILNLSPEDRLILLSVKLHPSPEEWEMLNDVLPLVTDWKQLIGTIIDRTIAPLLYKKLPLLTNSAYVPEEVQTKLQKAYYRTLSRSTLLYESFRRVLLAFNAQCIPVIALKGIYLSESLYHDSGLRQFSDIDIMVHELDGQRCLAILTEMGYIQQKNPKTISVFIDDLNDDFQSKSGLAHYLPMYLNGTSIEIHVKLHNSTEKYQQDVAELWKNAVPVTINTVPVYALQLYDLLIHLCLHLDKHFWSGHVQFSCFSDITNLLDKHWATMDWEDFSTVAKATGGEQEVFRYLIMVNKYFNAPLPHAVLTEYQHLLRVADEELFCKYLRGYTFRKEVSTLVPAHMENLRKLTNTADYLHYLRDVIFPPKAFMIEKYLGQLIINNEQLIIKNHEKNLIKQIIINYQLLIINYLWFLWYPYRWFIGLRGLLRLVNGK